MSFSNVGLSDAVLQGLSASGYSRPTEIQLKTIPLVLAGKDLIGCAPTGTGKTAAFVLPILHCLGKPNGHTQHSHYPRALILTPTRELAAQIEEAIRSYGTHCDLKPVAVYGGVDIDRQIRSLRNGVDIVVATPGRLLDLMERRSIDLSRIEILVLDEADRMFDMGFIKAVRQIIARVPRERQTLLFSATMSPEVRSLVANIQRTPHYIEIGEPFSPVTTVSQKVYRVSQITKTNFLVHILKNETVETMLVFSRTKHGADKIARQLERSGIKTAAIHSNRSQSQRQKTLEGFKRRSFQVLVATDVAARGIDVTGITHVVNYDTPRFAEDYIHRIGRTGRAEKKGIAFTFVARDEEKYLRRIELMIGKRFEISGYPGFATDEPPVAAIVPSMTKCVPFFGRRTMSFSTQRIEARRA
jgi:ATP-dependent RNA helicase RhlE